MNQTALPLELPLPTDRIGFQLGLDHARHGLAPTPEAMRAGAALHEGWLAGRALFGQRAARSTRALRTWLSWRTQAWIDGVPFDLDSLTPAALEAMLPRDCPVHRRPLGGLPGSADAPVLLRLAGAGAYRAGAVAWVSHAAAQAAAGALDTEAWRRLSALRALATPMPHVQALRTPLALLPPPGVVPANPAQRLQLWITLELAAPGWSTRLRQLADLIDDSGTRQDFQLFIGALAPRALELPTAEGGQRLRHALEDLWSNPRVMQRWSSLALALGEAGTLQLLARAAQHASRHGLRVAKPAAAAPVKPRRWPVVQPAARLPAA